MSEGEYQAMFATDELWRRRLKIKHISLNTYRCSQAKNTEIQEKRGKTAGCLAELFIVQTTDTRKVFVAHSSLCELQKLRILLVLFFPTLQSLSVQRSVTYSKLVKFLKILYNSTKWTLQNYSSFLTVNIFMKFDHLSGQKRLTRKHSGTFIVSNKIS